MGAKSDEGDAKNIVKETTILKNQITNLESSLKKKTEELKDEQRRAAELSSSLQQLEQQVKDPPLLSFIFFEFSN
jgi:prefoldin subunit 5